MQIKTVTVENFGCLERASMDFSAFTVLIGPNNAGKSTFLLAIDKFFSTAPKIEKRNFFRHDETRTISISIVFSNLTPEERVEFGNAVIDGTMRVTRQFGGELGTAGVFSVDALSLPEFQAFREEPNGTTRRTIYAELRREFGLPSASGTGMDDALSNWEAEHPGQLKPTRTRGFFGAPNVAVGKLRKKTAIRFIPASTQISSETDGPKSPLIELLADIRRQTLENQSEYVELVRNANDQIRSFVEKREDGGLASISTRINSLLKGYYADTEFSAELPPPTDIAVAFPPPAVTVRHRAIQGSVDHVGHGLQRAILFSVVQYLAEHFSAASAGSSVQEFLEPVSDIILLIEEPEIYQHPQKQRIIKSVLEGISNAFDKNTGIRVQVAICTHSEKFVGIRNISAIRLVRTAYMEDNYTTSVTTLGMEEFRDGIYIARGRAGPKMAIETFAASLHVFSDAISEGFFADKVIIVEGVDDAAVIEGTYRSLDRNPQAEGISIIQCDGKTKLDKPFFAFGRFGMKVFCVFDNDRHQKTPRIDYNKLLQAIAGIETPTDAPAGVFRNFAAVEGNLEAYIKERCGDQYQSMREKVAESFAMQTSDIGKSPVLVSSLLSIARAAGITFPLFEEIVANVDKL